MYNVRILIGSSYLHKTLKKINTLLYNVRIIHIGTLDVHYSIHYIYELLESTGWNYKELLRTKLRFTRG
jgi:hypothetical protein